MFHKEFFPTPREVADKMLEPYRELIKSGVPILDPSAGKGDLLNAAKWMGAKEKSLFAIEINNDLAAICKSKNYRVIGDDFFTYSGQYLFGLIVMNPPFSNADDHLLRAWDILREGEIVCLVNSETIQNPYTQTRKLLSTLISDYGSVEHIGNAFATAERKTGANVTIVRLSKKAGRSTFDFSRANVQQNKTPTQETGHVDLESQVAKADLIKALCESYEQIGPAYEQYLAASRKLSFYVRSVVISPCFKSKSADARYGLTGDAASYADYNAYMDEIKHQAWQTVFERTNLKSVLTSRTKEDFNKFQQETGGVDFNEANIWALFEMLMINRGDNLQKCIVEVFDMLTAYDKKNKIHVEGWKTNSAYKVNRKVILPWFIELSKYGGGFSVNYRMVDKLRDIDLAMCVLTGKRMEDKGFVSIENALRDRFSNRSIGPDTDFSNKVLSEFFEITYFKKGTIHIVFRDKWLWDEFNRRACKGKGWIGDGE